MKAICSALFLVLILSANAQEKQNNGHEHTVFSIVETMPEFPGGMEALYMFIGETLQYPDEANAKGASGTVFVSFIVDKSGTVRDATVVKSVDPALDQAALDMVNKMPDWKPGVQDEKAVNVIYHLPVKFQIPGSK